MLVWSMSRTQLLRQYSRKREQDENLGDYRGPAWVSWWLPAVVVAAGLVNDTRLIHPTRHVSNLRSLPR